MILSLISLPDKLKQLNQHWKLILVIYQVF